MNCQVNELFSNFELQIGLSNFIWNEEDDAVLLSTDIEQITAIRKSRGRKVTNDRIQFLSGWDSVSA
jgi:hypothetical protein